MEVELLRTRTRKSKTLMQALWVAICYNVWRLKNILVYKKQLDVERWVKNILCNQQGLHRRARLERTNRRGNELQRRRIKEKDAVARRISDRKGRRRLINPHNHFVLPLTDRHCGIIQTASDWMQQNVCCGKL
ncbi:unnamed protein product [Cuscuta campestris]|uniref:Uncharacterized protein n=1 Tax=Cuscuta campestris TaxID=132261 RepID=A0A484KB54_9ASTE|nr:unnamed protein product [Cuscuta campestris]